MIRAVRLRNVALSVTACQLILLILFPHSAFILWNFIICLAAVPVAICYWRECQYQQEKAIREVLTFVAEISQPLIGIICQLISIFKDEECDS